MVVEPTDRIPVIAPLQWRNRWMQLVSCAQDAFLEVDGSGVVIEWNPRAEQLFGWRRGDVVGRPVAETLMPEGLAGWGFPRVAALKDPGSYLDQTAPRGPGVHRRFQMIDNEGHRIEVEGLLFTSEFGEGRCIGGFIHPSAGGDMVDAALARAALHDTLTGLPNRALFTYHLGYELATCGGSPGSVAVVLLDLDRFKAINNTKGHHVGDVLLMAVTERLERVAGDAELLARFGGDEFLALFVDAGGCADILAAEFIERAWASLVEPFDVVGGEVFLDGSFGVALNTFGVDDPADLLSNAEAAMYRAKDRGGSGSDTFCESMRIEVLDRMTTEHSLHRALERSELMLHYQPVVEIEGITTVGVEALIRWSHPEQGLVSPYRFIPVAEESGLIIPIGAWVLEEACHQLRDWHHQADNGSRGSIEVNLSARQISDPLIVTTVEEILSRTGLPAEHLTLEITESALMNDASTAAGVLCALKEIGVLLAIDDFGTGYSSLSYLRRFPLDILKVDRSFVEDLGVNAQSEEIVSAVIKLAHALGLKVVAEGVETAEQLEVLRSFECDLAQGYLFARPLPAAEIVASFGLPISA